MKQQTAIFRSADIDSCKFKWKNLFCINIWRMGKIDNNPGFKILVENTDGFDNRQYRPWLPSPPKLVEYVADLVNEKSMPICWEWTIEEVNEWLKKNVGLSQYQDCIRRNFINGRRLLLLETFGFEKIGICDYFHKKTISAAVRKLFGVENPKNDRSISLPSRYPWTHYLLYRVSTGPTRESTTPFELFQKMGILDKSEPCPFGHWEMIEPTWRPFPCNRFGLAARKSVYLRVEHPRQPRGHSYLKKLKIRSNYFIRADIK